MGQSILSVKDQLSNDYKYIKKYSNSCYGELTLLESKSSMKKYALKQILTDNPSIDSILKQKKLSRRKGFIGLVDYWVKVDSSFCSTVSQVYLLLEYEEMTLEEEIIERQHRQREFTDDELRNILLSGITVLVELQKGRNNFHMGIENTLINGRCEIKVVEPELVSGNLAPEESKKEKKRHFCDEPQLTEESEESLDLEGSRTKASVFYLGVMLLACCTLDETLEEQVISNNSYDFEKLRKVCKSISYIDKRLSNLLYKMVKKNPFKRPSFSEILS